jgi:hypothetical protein
MARHQLDVLQLNQEQVETAAAFFAAYANYRLSSDGDRADGGTSLMDAASSLRIAAQWALLFDTQRAVNLLSRSAILWNTMGYDYGTFLLAAFAPRQVRRDIVVARISEIANLSLPGLPATTDISPNQQAEATPLVHPQQQAYLLLSSAAMARRLDLPNELLKRVLEQSPHRRGVAPVGALGTPIRIYWNIAQSLLSDDDQEAARLVANDLAGMATAYAEDIDSAMANERLWFNAAAPVDVGDIDSIAIALVTAYRLGRELTQVHLRRAMEGLRPLARVPLELAVEMIDALDDRQGEGGRG